MNKNITIVLLAVGIIFLAWVLLSDGCGKPTDSHTDDYEQVKAERDSMVAREEASKHREDSLTESLHQADTIIADLKAETEVGRIELDRSKDRASRLASELQVYKHERDTSEFGRKIDSLIAEVSNLTFLLNHYERYTDSLTNLYEKQKITYENLLNEKAQLYAHLRSSYDHVYKQYDQLFRDYTDRGKSLKREKLKSKIAALLALVATGLLIVK